MSKNWMRHFELQLINDSGHGISLSDLKVTFQIESADTKFPRAATVKIYNLSDRTSSKILSREFTKIRIIAGYLGLAEPVNSSEVGKPRPIAEGQQGQHDGLNTGVIFSGDIRFTLTGKDRADNWVQIQALGDHEAFLYAAVNATLKAGYRPLDMHHLMMQSFNSMGVTQGLTGEFKEVTFPRGRPVFSMARDAMDDVAGMCRATWQLVDGQLQMVPEEVYVHEAIDLNSGSGLIGSPQQTLAGGINATCLINPRIKINGLVNINQSAIIRNSPTTDNIQASKEPIKQGADGSYPPREVTKPKPNEGKSTPATIATDGLYVVKSIDYDGDTRGTKWYMTLMCVARGEKKRLDQQAKTAADNK